MIAHNINALIEYSASRQVRKRVFMSDKIEMEMVCYEPGQATVEHHHVGQDEIFLIMEGRGTIGVNDETVEVSPGSCVFIPAEARHSVTPDPGGRMVMVFVKAPGRGSKPGRARAS